MYPGALMCKILKSEPAIGRKRSSTPPSLKMDICIAAAQVRAMKQGSFSLRKYGSRKPSINYHHKLATERPERPWSSRAKSWRKSFRSSRLNLSWSVNISADQSV
ncbi:hypothetical protein FVE85_8833 [Porphyridium purpureum]|uniref:Uncharacterized protein n=1 Tax=Porphyridium purpureum TaxID=35688 RepID=A0A5J4YQ13_PORPP|nr:hypothetical protein FVE85_8833 [Porphyridium purpureum]|eukprot:POR4724..scf296_7